jgi:hypothetical protein
MRTQEGLNKDKEPAPSSISKTNRSQEKTRSYSKAKFETTGIHSQKTIKSPDDEIPSDSHDIDFRSASLREDRDDPLSIKELQNTPNSVLRVRNKSNPRTENKETDTQTKEKLKEQALSNLPDSIRKVKDDIKKKIEK